MQTGEWSRERDEEKGLFDAFVGKVVGWRGSRPSSNLVWL